MKRAWPQHLVARKLAADAATIGRAGGERATFPPPGSAPAPGDHVGTGPTAQACTARPFEDMPGPKGLPLIGSLLDYTPLGNLQSNLSCSPPLQRETAWSSALLGTCHTCPFSLKKLHESFFERYRQFGKISKETIGNKCFVSVYDPSDIETLFRTEGPNPSWMQLMALGEVRKRLGKSLGMINETGEKWRRLRYAAQSKLLKPQNVRSFVPVLDDISRDLVEKVRVGRSSTSELSIDMDAELRRWSLESVVSATLGIRLGCLQTDRQTPDKDTEDLLESSDAFLETWSTLELGLPLYMLYPTKTWRKFLRANEQWLSAAGRMIDRSLDRNDSQRDPLQPEVTLLEHIVTRKELTPDDIVMIITELIFAGIETTAVAMTYNLYTMAKNQAVQEKARREVNAVVGEGGKVTQDALKSLKYIKACIKETFRVLPVFSMRNRILDKEIVLSGYRVPPNVIIRVLTHVTGQLPEYVAEPDRFVPERWLRDDVTMPKPRRDDVTMPKPHPFAVRPFGVGSRSCIGQRLAEQELGILLAKMVQQFHIECDGEMDQVFNIANKPDLSGTFKFTEV
ncbi:CYP27B1 [Branchiostoma lanceolatum]|uniref:CYP27B1 protein n=1 Tax=Branchiostoma lanceolatum TaxID=7740 RepID=A0A8J9YMS2_BRALA|nr:CYP27B1 [Branchiostoma lanceolatum]